MSRRKSLKVVGTLVLLLTALNPLVSSPAAQTTDPHGYFKTLLGRAEIWKSYPLRSQAEIDSLRKGNSTAPSVFYDNGVDAAKVVIPAGRNSLEIGATLLLPMGTAVGQSTLVTWDTMYTSSMAYGNTGIPTHKTFNFTIYGEKQIWWEVRNRWSNAPSGHISDLDYRSYFPAMQPVPDVGSFAPKANTWVRYWVFFEQPAAGQVMVSAWVADEQTNPRQIIDRYALNNPTNTIDNMWVEFNTSTDALMPGRGDIVSYVRNVAMLRNVASPTSLMQRPLASGLLPAPPTNLRVVVP